jgi:hypothetical protein
VRRGRNAVYFSTPITTANDAFGVEITKLLVWVRQNRYLFRTSAFVFVEVSVNRVSRDEL